jgi:hypothetical protein
MATIAACLATIMMVSCGGRSTSGADKQAQAIVNDDGIRDTVVETWPDNEYTKQLTKPDIDIKVSGIADMGRLQMFSLTFADSTTKAQVIACTEKIKADGFTNKATETDSGNRYFMYRATNSDGYTVFISWTEQASGLAVSKEKIAITVEENEINKKQ